MDEYQLAKRAYALPGRFADRLDPADLATVREYAEVGEWGEEIDLLLACLRAAHQPVTAAERAELVDLLKAMGMPAEVAEELSTDGGLRDLDSPVAHTGDDVNRAAKGLDIAANGVNLSYLAVLDL